MEFKNFNERVYDFPRLYENIEIVVFSAVSFFLPMVLGHPQLLVGSVINALIVISALHHPFRKALPVIMLPSLGVLTAGLLFGSFTSHLVYMIPFIWIGNALLWFGIKYFYVNKKKNIVINSIGSSFVKAFFLFSIASVFYFSGLVPQMFLIAMGPLQLGTALMGCIIGKGFSEVVVRAL
ncbi:hypothetical protein JXB41_01680 [Candidatus Woesearchaeota archaeon]|nr:hypothetical protein [Candidatus Woesearchaeota archaeon]